MSLQKNLLNIEDISKEERDILKDLASQISEIASLPVHNQTISQWKRLNNLKHGRFMVWINEVPWHEIEKCGEIEFLCKNDFARGIESSLKIILYMWNNARADMVVEPVYRLPAVIYDTGYGVNAVAQYASTGTGIISRSFIPQIKDESDINKIQFPEITPDWELTEKRTKILREIFSDTLKVENCGVSSIWFAPWDYLVVLTGVEEALMSLATRPGFVHGLIERYMEASIHKLDQLHKKGLLSPNNGNYRIGSGGLGYTDDLPDLPFSKTGISPEQQWGFSTSQIFSEVSPQMHKEFALNYERRWLEKFGLTYYGCCEPLHNKIHILEEIENLRKISISPKADVKTAAEKIKDRYVISYKPNPAVLACENWDRKIVKDELKKVLEIFKENGCIVEIIMKDISTIRYQPERLREWYRIAMEAVAELT